MTGTVALTVSRSLILTSTDEFVRLVVEQGIQRFFYAVTYEILLIILYKILVKLYNVTRHGLLPPYEFCVVT